MLFKDYIKFARNLIINANLSDRHNYLNTTEVLSNCLTQTEVTLKAAVFYDESVLNDNVTI